MPTSTDQHQGTCPAHHGFEPFDQNDPFPSYSELRHEEPVMYDERIDYWVVTRYDDIKAVFDDWERFSSANAQAPVRERGPQAEQILKDGGFTAYSGLSARVPPEHTRIRGIVAKGFTPRRYKAMEPSIRANVELYIERMLAHPEPVGDVLTDLANDIPTITILTLIGADAERQIADYKRWSASRAAMTWSDLNDEEQIPHAHNLVEFWQECLRLVEEAHHSEKDSLVGDLVRAQESGDPISDHEIASVCYSLLFAGHETTTTLISNSVRLLLEDRERWQSLVDDPKVIPNAIEEILRMSPSIVAWRRKAMVEAQVGDVTVPEGANLLLVMGSANRDSAHFDDPDRFEARRTNAREHLAFGYGIHYCLGNKLAKLQAKILLEELTARCPSLRLTGDPIEFASNISFRVPTSVPVTWER